MAGTEPQACGPGFSLRTERLVLRSWRESDRRPFAAMNADPAVMAYFPQTMSKSQSDALIESFNDELDRTGFCPFALELGSSGEFIGFTGLHEVPAMLPFAPAVEIGWRLSPAYWKKGYASEAAIAALCYGFFELSIEHVVSFSAATNVPSQKVMARIGLLRDDDGDFEHPLLEPGHLLRPHVLYRASSVSWRPPTQAVASP